MPTPMQTEKKLGVMVAVAKPEKSFAEKLAEKAGKDVMAAGKPLDEVYSSDSSDAEDLASEFLAAIEKKDIKAIVEILPMLVEACKDCEKEDVEEEGEEEKELPTEDVGSLIKGILAKKG